MAKKKWTGRIFCRIFGGVNKHYADVIICDRKGDRSYYVTLRYARKDGAKRAANAFAADHGVEIEWAK